MNYYAYIINKSSEKLITESDFYQKLKNKLQVNETKSINNASWKKRNLGSLINTKTEKNDVIIIAFITDLDRDPYVVFEILKTATSKQIKIYSISDKQYLNNGKSNKDIENTFNTSMLIVNQLRQKRRRGRPEGTKADKHMLDDHKHEIIKLLKNGASKTFIAKKFGCSRPTLYAFLGNIDIKTNIKDIRK